MRIKQITSQHRRDFTAVYECEHCGHTHTAGGYDDANFHENVVPDMKCPACGLKAANANQALAPKYPAHQVV